MLNIIPRPALDVRAIASALANMEPDIWAPPQPAEAWTDVLARTEARADIIDHLLIDAGCEGHCCLCGGDGVLGAGACPVCSGSGRCGCH